MYRALSGIVDPMLGLCMRWYPRPKEPELEIGDNAASECWPGGRGSGLSRDMVVAVVATEMLPPDCILLWVLSRELLYKLS
jgi:hypothetical protein